MKKFFNLDFISQNKIQDPAKLRQLIVELIGKETWLSLTADVKGDAYEGLLERNAQDIKSGAGQYFTPRGIINAIISGRLAGEVAAEAIKKGDTSREFLAKYDELWKEDLEDRLLRNYIAKEKLCHISDDIFNKIIESLAGYKIEKITNLEILRMIQERYPEVVEELEDLL